MVGVKRFELPTPWSQTKCATKLRYTPLSDRFIYDSNNIHNSEIYVNNLPLTFLFFLLSWKFQKNVYKL